MQGPVSQRVRQNAVPPKRAPAMQPAMNADRYCAYNLTRQQLVAPDVEAADGNTSHAEARLREVGPGEEMALWISPYRTISSSSAPFPLDLVLLDGDSVVLETVEFFPMIDVGAASAQATSLLVLAADSVAQRGIKPGDQLAISAPEEMMLYFRGAQNDGEHLPETMRVIPWPKNGARTEERPGAAKEEPVHKVDHVEPKNPSQGAVTKAAAKPPEKEEAAIAASETVESAPAEAATELQVHEEPVVATSESSESTPPQTAAEFPHKEEPVAVMHLHSQVAPMPVQTELPREDAPAQEPPVVASPRRRVRPPKIAAELLNKNTPMVAALDRSEGTPKQPAAELPRKVEPAPASPVVPIVGGESALVKSEAELRIQEAPAPAPLVVPLEHRPVYAPPIPEGLPPTNDVPAPPNQPRQWRNDETPKNWLMRLLKRESHDPRSAPRESLPELVAYFFTGGPPMPSTVRDMSTTGLYLVTHERWWKGTVVQMTLTDRNRPTIGRSMALYAEAVRLGSDGVGFRFVLEEDRRRNGRVIELYAPTNGIDRMQVGRFMLHFKATNPAAQ